MTNTKNIEQIINLDNLDNLPLNENKNIDFN